MIRSCSLTAALSLRLMVSASALVLGLPLCSFASAPQVRTVPGRASNVLIPHETIAGRDITVKGTSSIAGSQVRGTWNFGDGSSPASFTVTNPFDVSARHVYYGVPGAVFH